MHSTTNHANANSHLWPPSRTTKAKNKINLGAWKTSYTI